MLEIPYFLIVSSTFHKIGNTVFYQLSNFWNGQISASFQIGNELEMPYWKHEIHYWKHKERYRNVTNSCGILLV